MSMVPARSLTATVVAVVSSETQADVSETLASLAKISGVRPIIVSLGGSCEPPRQDAGGAIMIDGIVPRYLNNAVACLRLSSLPTLAWWRAGDAARLQDLAVLVDRIVMDLDDPSGGWSLVPGIAPLASVSDVRWARLTRWRDLIAQFFDIPEVREGFAADRLEVAGTDAPAARLLGGWLRARLPLGERLDVVHEPGGVDRIQSVRLSGSKGSLAVTLVTNGTCLKTTVALQTGPASSRVVALGDQHLVSLLGQELRVRSRDLAFEDAVREAERL
jgi:glucose-6-phosphate dehydrogenase assembly protein OpcA